MLITQEAAKMDLVNHLSGIQMIIESAIKKYDTEIIPSHKAIFDASTRSHITNEFMRFEAVSYAQKNNLETVITNRMFLLIISSQNGRYAVRFKKLDRYGFSNNITTYQTTKYKGQDSLDEIETKVNLDAGYFIDKDNNVEYFLALPNNNSIQWVVDLKTLNDITLHADMFEEYYSDNDLVTSKTTEISELPYEKTGTKDKQ